MFDAIIVGARAAGSPTAMLLARKGHRVLVVDRATFPSDTLSTHYIHQPGVARLRRWGLLDRLIATGCPPSRQLVFDVGPFALIGAPLPSDGVAEGYAPRRTVLDSLLLEAAAEAGAEIRTGFPVDELVVEDGAVVGIRSGDVVERAGVVIGADGRNSFIARAVQAPEYDTRPGIACAYYTYWAGVEGGDVELYPREGHMVMGGARTNDGLNIVIVFWPKNEFRAVRTDVERSFHTTRSRSHRRSPSASQPESAPTASTGSATSRSTIAGPTVPGGRSSAMPATTRIRSPRRESRTPSATPNCSPTHSTRVSAALGRSAKRSPTTSARGTRRRAASTSSRTSSRHSRRRRRSSRRSSAH